MKLFLAVHMPLFVKGSYQSLVSTTIGRLLVIWLILDVIAIMYAVAAESAIAIFSLMFATAAGLALLYGISSTAYHVAH